jgi:hypothetical protein
MAKAKTREDFETEEEWQKCLNSRNYWKNYRSKNSNSINSYHRKRYRMNIDYERERSRLYRLNNPEKRKETIGKYFLDNTDIIRSRCRRSAKKLRLSRKKTVLTYYSNNDLKCNYCGIANYMVLTIDHINGGGRKHVKELQKNGTYLYKWLIDNHFPSGYQVLCYNCNCSKHINDCYKNSPKYKIIKHYSNGQMCCKYCEKKGTRFLCVDHINGSGGKERKKIRSNIFYHWLIKNNFPEGYQILCWNCNSIKAYFKD